MSNRKCCPCDVQTVKMVTIRSIHKICQLLQMMGHIERLDPNRCKNYCKYGKRKKVILMEFGWTEDWAIAKKSDTCHNQYEMTKISPHSYNVCNCCLELRAIKSIWKEFSRNGRCEVYGDMLQECLNISWSRDRDKDTICEVCITRLRNAVFFKQCVLEAQAKLEDWGSEADTTDLKIHTDLMLNNDDCQPFHSQIQVEIVPIKKELEEIGQNETSHIDPNIDEVKMECKYENDINNAVLKTEPVKTKLKVVDVLETDKIPIHKLSKQFMQRNIREETHKKPSEYVVVDFVYAPAHGNPALTRNGKVRNIDSPITYNPAKSRSTDNTAKSRCTDSPAKSKSTDNTAKLKSTDNAAKSRSTDKPARSRSGNLTKSRCIGNPAMTVRKHDGKQVAKGRQSLFIRLRLNACLLLEHSTLLPFKCKKGYIDCFYCDTQFVNFDEMKTHTTQNHNTINFETISKCIMRPNAKVRVDATFINCKLCDKHFPTIKDLIKHLIETHCIEFNDAVKPEDCIMPYELGDGKFKCYECKKEFTFFLTLTQHMNEHSTDYVCDICGRCFLLFERLKAHVALHMAKTAKCDACGKVCPNVMSLRSHVRHHHTKRSYKCLLCNIKFENNAQRLEHFQVIHKRVPINLNCKICSKKFGNLSTLNSHIRATHLRKAKEAKFGCSECNMKFTSSHKLKNHNLVHSGVKKFECEVCHKKFARAFTIKEHLKIHYNDKRWSCRVCGQCFVQKCSVKSHIRVHHSEYDVDATIVYKKRKDK